MDTNIKATIKRILFGSYGPTNKLIFILSAPRSGSTHLYEILRRCESVISLDEENDAFWWSYFPYSRLDSPSDYISGDEITKKVSSQLQDSLFQHVCQQDIDKGASKYLSTRLTMKSATYLEKTVANCFHLEALAKLFPDAKYIHLIRDGNATISSMLEGWKSKRFMQRNLPFGSDSTIDYWTYPIPPNWESQISQPLNKICAWSWVQHNQYVLDFFSYHLKFKDKLIQVSYEELVSNPESTINSIIDFCGLHKNEHLLSYIDNNNLSRTTISKPDPMKWLQGNKDEILEIEPYIQPMQDKLGY